MASQTGRLLRMTVLTAAFSSLVLVTLRVLVRPEVAQQRAPEQVLQFPEAIALPEWQLQEARPWLDGPERETSSPTPQGRRYAYTAVGVDPEDGGDRPTLSARARFLYRAGNGNTSRLLQTYTSARPASINIATAYREGAGFYGFFLLEDEASVMACVNPYGDTTVTGQQFSQNITFQPGRVLPWLLGRQDLFDRRCLFSILSVPARPGETSLTDYPELEATWFAWVAHWQQTLSKDL